ncbi:transposase, partial [Xanthomonas oryzae pv. oryzae]|uniref:transposase n=1 Tax=Xanthomonas oryzae TaxID=347 RepID=UPI00095A325F
MQLTFGDAEYNGKRKRTRREVFLAEMDQVVPWKGLLALIEPHYPKSGQPGRQPYRLETMLRIHFLQQWYALSDPSAEEALYDTVSMRRFAKIGGVGEGAGGTEHPHFRALVEVHDTG